MISGLILMCAVYPLQLNSGQLTQLMENMTSTDDDGESKQLPDCIQSENGLVLTDLGRMQVRIYSFYWFIGKNTIFNFRFF